MSKNIRWTLARNRAIQTLGKFSIETFPLQLFKLIDKIPHLAIMSYLEMCKQLNEQAYSNNHISVDWVQEHLADGSQDAALLKMSNSKDTIILYNSDLFASGITKQRIRYSIAHEIGHFVLRHNFQTMIARDGLSSSEYIIYEKEADAFAATLLMPSSTFSNEVSVSKLREQYDVSKQAAEIMVDTLTKKPFALPSIRLQNFRLSKPRKYAIPSDPFSLLGFKYYAYCSNCRGLTGGDSPKVFCAYCGCELKAISYEFDFFKIHESFGGQIMKYSEIKVDSSGHADTCPQCGFGVSANDLYCPICGVFLINQCTGIFNADDPFAMPQGRISFELESNSGCGKKLPGYARYCSHCGASSSFALQHLLKSWSQEKKQNLQTAPLDISDDDLPF
ncbi:ImmA/IrrE family metallo-endopeptidase [Lacticaseibacillus paracasei]|uniref:IrrE N-terminal-like domain-containing protein n=1 Tax=Lacticaseibacillus paracasei NRIC 0644 TaxID=1435038 RepID=A0A0C9PWH2_LACPA|nr:ImmA/IrrE family metallo-endopeptidase [Lacticaseibacillus paracasei]GAN36444.1 hypothetical protein LC0644_1033 [Lacticaseibacillus paracasei NRIC 0644]GAN39211.1 hypothetical protein LC1917_1088 [Lacticaseibacillus paracasei NRIC 1917]